MHIEKLTPTFGSIVHSNYEQAINDGDQLRELLYDSKVLVIRGLGELNLDQLWDLHARFGTPWSEADYSASIRETLSKMSDHKVVPLFGNKAYNKLVVNAGLPWHRDIPWHRQIRYPIRSLYAHNDYKTPTEFSDASVLLDSHANLNEVELLIQYWYSRQFDSAHRAGDFRTKYIPLVENHPHTGKPACLLNCFGLRGEQTPTYPMQTSYRGSWILGCRINGRELPNDEYLSFMSSLKQEAIRTSHVYTHEWMKYDLLLFDNHSGVWHRRDVLHPDDTVRTFYRMNLRHYWQTEEQPPEQMK